MSGIDLLQRIREFDPAIPVIIMTAYGSSKAPWSGQVGCVRLHEKPVDLEELKLLADRARENSLLRQELRTIAAGPQTIRTSRESSANSPPITAVLQQAVRLRHSTRRHPS